MQWLDVPLLLHHFSKTRNWITQPIMATFTRSKFVLGAVIYSFLMNLRTVKMAQWKWRYAVIKCTPRPASLLKNSQLNYSMNTGHIYKIKVCPRSCKLYLSNEPKSSMNGPEKVKKINYYSLSPLLLIKNPHLNFKMDTGHIVSLNLFRTRLYCVHVPQDF